MIKIIYILVLMLAWGLASGQNIAFISPTTGPVGTLVTITGTDLSNPTAFTIGGTQAIVISNDGTTLVGMVMPGAVTGNVSITTANGTAVSESTFTVIPTPYPSVQQGNKLVGTGVSSNASQGYSVSLSADGNTAIVGGYVDNGYTGAAWVYIRSGGVWTQQGSKLVGTSSVGQSRQGWSVSLSADGNTAIVGGYNDNAGAGAAWVYTRSGGVWTQQGSKLVGTGVVGTSYQGYSVSLSADGNTAIVGGYYDNSGAGSAWVYTRSGDVWTQQGSKLVGTGAVGPSYQGYSVSLSDDGNTSIVGGYNDNASVGAAWVYTRSAGVWTQQGSKLVGTGAVGQSTQGTSVSISADGNTAIVGGYYDNSGAGAAWVYTRSADVWTQEGSKLVGTGRIGQSYQGQSVSLSDDGNTAIVGGYNDNNGAGAAWVYTRSSGVWSQQGSKMVGTGVVGSAYQGYSVSVSADGNTAIVGGFFDNNAIGAAWVFTQSGGVWTQQGNKLVGTGAVGSAYQGYSVSVSADGNTAIVGGFFDNNNVGAAWVYTRSGGVWTQQGGKLVGTGAVGQSYQGQSVSISADGNTVIVGGYGDNSGIGAAWIYTRSGGVWTQQGSKLVGTGFAIQSFQGSSVSLSGDGNTAIVGGKQDQFGFGAAWVFIRSGGVWTQQGGKLVGTGAVGSAEQGYSVSLSADGNTAIVGGYSDNGGIGAAWVYTRSGGGWTQQGGKLVGTDAIGFSRQGKSVSLNADGNTAIVGGYSDNSGTGAAWVYTHSGGVWTQQGSKLVGTGSIPQSSQGSSVSLSADGNTAIVGGFTDNGSTGAVWVYTRTIGVWTQQGSKLVGTSSVGQALQGWSVSLSANGITAVVGGYQDNGLGAVWMYTVAPMPTTITSISPDTGPVGTLVTITGTNLSNPTSFAIGSTQAIVVSNDGTKVVGMVMPGAVTGNVSITTANGTATSGGSFTVTPTLYPNVQQGEKLVGTGGTFGSRQGYSVSVSADGNTAIVGGHNDNGGVGAAWIFIRSGEIWTQQGSKLVGTGAIGNAVQGTSVSLSADGNTAIVGGPNDNGGVGAVWVFTRINGLWRQQGNKLVGTGAIGQSKQGTSVSISADGNTAIVGGKSDNNFTGAAWVYTRINGLWSQLGNKLSGTGAVGDSQQGTSVSISADGNTAVVGGYTDNVNIGAVWIYTRNGGVWTQQGSKLVGTGAAGTALQGTSVSLSADGNTVIVGGRSDNGGIGAAWVYTRIGGVWSQQGNKLVGLVAVSPQEQGNSVSISADGNTAIVGGSYDNGLFGATWIFTRNGSVWTQQGSKLVGSGGIFSPEQGISVSISADGNTAIVGGPGDASQTGAAWVFINSLCANPTSAGSIGNPQTGCGSITPSAITSTALPSGHSGTLEYKWQISTLSSSSGFTDIGGSNSATYAPGVFSQTSWYKRLARATCMTDWTGAVESNVIEITVYPALNAPTANVTTQPTCSLATGTITVSAPVPSEGIFYSIDGSDYTNTTGVFTEVAPGDYEVTVKDGNQCISEATSVTVDPQPSAPTIAVGSVINPETCGGLGSIVLNFTNVPDGTYIINYSAGSFTNVSVSANTATLSAMAGTYTDLQITVNGCTSAAGVDVTLSDPGVSYGILASGNETFCNSGDPALILFSSMPEGSATFGYQWYYANGLMDNPTGTDATGWTLITGATSSSFDPPAGLTQSRTYAVMVAPDCGNSVATWAVGARQITVGMAPVVAIGVNSPNNFNSDLVLTANPSSAGDYTYLWSPGDETTPSITLNSTHSDGLYTVVVSMTGECASTPVSYNYQKQNLVNSYTILGLSQVTLSANNFVQTGSVGNTAKNGKVIIGLNSLVNGPGAFVKAKSITVASPSLVPLRILQPVTAVLPVARTNTSNPKAFANLNVAGNQTVTYSGNYRDVTIGTNSNVTFSGTIFGKMTIGQSSQVTFTAATVNVQSISMANGTTTLPGKLLFGSDASVLVSNGVTIGNNSQINTAADYSVVFYMNGFDFHVMPGGNVTVNASVYSPKGSITVEGHIANATHMVGTFIASNVTSKNSNIYWNSEVALPLVAPALSVVKSAEIVPAVLEPQVKFYPNPFTQKLNFEFSHITDAHARLEIFNIAGSRLETIFDGNIKGGELYNVEYRPRLFSSQTLIYHLTLGGKVYVDKVIYQERK